MTGRPVKLMLPRDQMFGPVGHRGATRQRLRIGIDATGGLTVLDHDALATTSTFDDFVEGAANASQGLYAAPALRSAHHGVRVDTGTPGPMRAPGEAPGSAALECAMDEMAETGRARSAGLPAAQLRRDRARHRPALFVQGAARMLRAGCRTLRLGRPAARAAADARRRPVCSSAGAWARRSSPPRCSRPRPARCCAPTAPAWSKPRRPTWARAPGRRLPRSPPTASACRSTRWSSAPAVRDLPDGGVAGGSGHTATAGSALHAAGSDAIARLAEIATADPASPLFGAGNAGVVARDGRLHGAGRRRAAAKATPTSSPAPAAPRSRARAAPPAARKTPRRHAMYSHGAVFAEVKVDPDLVPDPRHPPGRRLRGRADHQPEAGREPASGRHDLGHLLRPARGGAARPRAPAGS